ncbi:MAG: radical SAM protein [Candidatus Woesearchaeota archaeon]
MFKIKGLNVTNGKGDWIKERQEDGSLEDACLCLHNTDFSRGCVADCDYCYAGYKNKNPSTPTAFSPAKHEKQLKARFDESGIRVLRYGKLTDPGPIMYRENLIQSLEIVQKLKGKGILINKYLEFDKTIARLSRETGTAICFSEGYDDLENWACSHGSRGEDRLEIAGLYHEAGANVILKLATNVTVAPEDNDKFAGGMAQRTIDFGKKYGIHTTLLPFRIKSKKIAYRVTGVDWHVLIDDQRTFLDPNQTAKAGSFIMEEKIPPDIVERIKNNNPTKEKEKRRVTYLIPAIIDPAYSEFEENMWICGKVGDIWTGYEYCDKCHLTGPDGELLEPVKFRQFKLPFIDTSEGKNSVSKANQKKQKKLKEQQQEEGEEVQEELFEDELVFF